MRRTPLSSSDYAALDKPTVQRQRAVGDGLRSDADPEELLRDEDIHSWFLDSDIYLDPAHPDTLGNGEPLLVNLTGTWPLRPDATTAIPNLFLASDYARYVSGVVLPADGGWTAGRSLGGMS